MTSPLESAVVRISITPSPEQTSETLLSQLLEKLSPLMQEKTEFAPQTIENIVVIVLEDSPVVAIAILYLLSLLNHEIAELQITKYKPEPEKSVVLEKSSEELTPTIEEESPPVAFTVQKRALMLYLYENGITEQYAGHLVKVVIRNQLATLNDQQIDFSEFFIQQLRNSSFLEFEKTFNQNAAQNRKPYAPRIKLKQFGKVHFETWKKHLLAIADDPNLLNEHHELLESVDAVGTSASDPQPSISVDVLKRAFESTDQKTVESITRMLFNTLKKSVLNDSFTENQTQVPMALVRLLAEKEYTPFHYCLGVFGVSKPIDNKQYLVLQAAARSLLSKES